MRQVKFVERVFEEEINGSFYYFDAVAEIHIEESGDNISEEHTSEITWVDIEIFNPFKLNPDGYYGDVTEQEYKEICKFLTVEHFE